MLRVIRYIIFPFLNSVGAGRTLSVGITRGQEVQVI